MPTQKTTKRIIDAAPRSLGELARLNPLGFSEEQENKIKSELIKALSPELTNLRLHISSVPGVLSRDLGREFGSRYAG